MRQSRIGQWMQALVACVMLWAVPVSAQVEPKVIVARGADTIEVFFRFETPQALVLFGAGQDKLQDETGVVRFEQFTSGTVPILETMWRGVDTQIGGEAAEFEPMSLMVHPQEDVLPFADAVDGVLAVSVCSTDGGTAALADTKLYAGVIAYTDTPNAPLAIRFPGAPEAEVTLEMTTIRQDGRRATSTVTMQGDGTLILPPIDPSSRLWLYGVSGIGAVFFGLFLVRAVRRQGASLDVAEA